MESLHVKETNLTMMILLKIDKPVESYEFLRGVYPELKKRMDSKEGLTLDLQSIPKNYEAVSLDNSFLDAYKELYLEKIAASMNSTEPSSDDHKTNCISVNCVIRYDMEIALKEHGCTNRQKFLKEFSSIQFIKFDDIDYQNIQPLMIGKTPLELHALLENSKNLIRNQILAEEVLLTKRHALSQYEANDKMNHLPQSPKMVAEAALTRRQF